MSKFKYEVGDKFRFASGHAHRTIMDRFHMNGEAMYVVSFEEATHEEISTEKYIDKEYVKIKPFFQVGKKYQFGSYGLVWTVEDVQVLKGIKFAIVWRHSAKDNMNYVVMFLEHDYPYYSEVTE